MMGWTEYLSIGMDKNGDWDFQIFPCLVGRLTYEKMQGLRAVVSPALACLEETFSKRNDLLDQQAQESKQP